MRGKVSAGYKSEEIGEEVVPAVGDGEDPALGSLCSVGAEREDAVECTWSTLPGTGLNDRSMADVGVSCRRACCCTTTVAITTKCNAVKKKYISSSNGKSCRDSNGI